MVKNAVCCFFQHKFVNVWLRNHVIDSFVLIYLHVVSGELDSGVVVSILLQSPGFEWSLHVLLRHAWVFSNNPTFKKHASHINYSL